MNSHVAQTPRIRGFDGLRGIAVLLVFLEHKFKVPGYYLGYLGVLLFFALSGLLIIRILHKERVRLERSMGDAVLALKRFYSRRALRLFPVYYVMLGIVYLLSPYGWFGGPKIQAGYPYHLTHVSNLYYGYVVGDWSDRLVPLWTLSIEEQFYLLFAPLLLFIPARRHFLVCCSAAGCGIAIHMFLALLGTPAMLMNTLVFPKWPFFAFSGAMMIHLTKGPTRINIGPVFVVGAGAMLLVTCRYPVVYSGVILELVVIALQVISSTFIVCWIYFHQQSWLVDLLEWRQLCHLGRISYGFYLYHNLIPNLSYDGIVKKVAEILRIPSQTESLGAMACFLIALAVSQLSWLMIERPLTSLKERWTT